MSSTSFPRVDDHTRQHTTIGPKTVRYVIFVYAVNDKMETFKQRYATERRDSMYGNAKWMQATSSASFIFLLFFAAFPRVLGGNWSVCCHILCCPAG
ncbi:hypothetical protein BCR43DRAFT_498133 [Syncephalastrum racemosum]|uniref:Uncharacterized protein n=1 Tax=Syncephalastrum racemosum TaxID=13706 RepID=A0A1X2H3A6_SYNRA|nr:hypothetical protein BCR43DRAFT_498133 [Syncephalastrum racemosum]